MVWEKFRFSGNGDFGLCPHINPSPMGTNFPNAGLTPIFSSGYYYNNSVIYNSPRVNRLPRRRHVFERP